MVSGARAGTRSLAAPALLLALAALAERPARALDPGVAVTQYVQTVWRAPKAIPHDDVTSIVQTRDGYLWVGTVEGLARFDGVRSVVFERANTPALANNWIRALLEDRTGRLWIGTFGGGLLYREGERFVRVDASLGMPYGVVNALAEDGAGRVFAGTLGGGLLRFEEGRFVREAGTEALAGGTVRSLLAGRSGGLFIGTESGLFRLDRTAADASARLTRIEGLTDEAVLSLAEDREGLWIGTGKGGLNRLVNGRVSAITTKDGLSHPRVWSLAVDRDENLWIGTDGGGLDRLSRGKLTAFTTRNGLTNDYVWSIREDREGSLWVATNGGGLTRLKNPRVVCLTMREGLPSDFVWAVAGAPGGGLWVGTEDAGVALVEEGRVRRYAAREGLAGSARVLLAGRGGSLRIGGTRGLQELREGRIRAVPVPGIALEDVHALAQDAAGDLWVGSTTTGLVRLGKGRPLLFTRAQGLSSDSISSLLPGRDGSLWVGTLGGVDLVAGGRVVRTIGKAEGLPNEYVTGLFEGPGGSVWAGTRGGLARIRDREVDAVTVREGLFDDAIMSAILGDDGTVWMGSNRGLFGAPLSEIEEAMDGRREKVRCRALGLEDGMRSVEVNASGSGNFKGPDGRLFFATRGGVASLLPARFARNLLPPPVAIEEVLADGRLLSGAAPGRLPAGTRDLSFHFTALSFLSPSAVRILHRLEGWDAGWQESEPDRTARYTNLPHGRYRFRVIAANDDGVWNQGGADVALEIAPRLTETLWFQVFAALLFVVAGPLFYLVRVRRLRWQKADLERLVAARTAEVQAANARLAQLAREDALTGLANRRSFDEALDAEWRRARRTGTPLSLLILDVDHFKAYNDLFGHPAGDACLKSVAGAVVEVGQRAGELVARYGGEEFAVLMPAVSLSSAEEAAEKVRRRVQALAIPHSGSPTAPVVTVSVGTACAEPAAGGDAEGLVGAADRALYRAKERGRNRIASGE